MAKIEIRDLTKIFGPAPDKALAMVREGKPKDEIYKRTGHAVGVNRATFDVEEGEIVVVMGLSGSGKSTLVRCLNRLIEPTDGTVRIDGTDVTTLSMKDLRALRQRTFGMVFQNFALFPHRTVLENAEYGLEVMGATKAARRDKAAEAPARVGLAGWEAARPGQLSGGMQQRVGLARALALDPDILLMDEAFSALDPLIRRDMQDELLRLQDDVRKTIVFISHDLDEALKIGDRIVLMRDGAVVQVGTPEDILTSPADDYVARFVADVDIARVLTAGTVMKRSEAVAVLGVDGPRTALRKMRNHAIATLFVLDRNHKLVGLVTADDIADHMAGGERDLAAIMRTDITTVSTDTPASELIPLMAGLPHPLAVTDERGRLAGVIVRGLLLGALAERGGNA
ncbi:glycine betaine/L-proline ABC transporter ATP-binding protein [Nitratidesulfovibrio liaohensis]|uniref:Glycine betaine/L-proline ABC transporter ATP-binding protein n=1 Tax=Nitratidesulfovibrio liaohensis TaxID=2604158 RepID=A0ABY9R4L8_9BACT|nr:glycine betaine/L-proline ABC transporter ATP-binding protein [Nitratidesulfovibrio liaohensis]WMW66695.1 glycine betaine/L-proline ABC transporter ATP-binding protein [Nitratidesulfovibrio liaohensis]